MIQNVDGTKQGVESLNWDFGLFHSKHLGLGRVSFRIEMQQIHALGKSFDGKRPEHGAYHLRPVPHTMQEQRPRTQSKSLFPVLNNSILMVRAHSAKCDLLIIIVH